MTTEPEGGEKMTKIGKTADKRALDAGIAVRCSGAGCRRILDRPPSDKLQFCADCWEEFGKPVDHSDN